MNASEQFCLLRMPFKEYGYIYQCFSMKIIFGSTYVLHVLYVHT